MTLVPTDYPDRLAARGLRVHVYSDWTTKGGDADHQAVVLHHTASSSSARPEDDAAYCHHGSSDAPLYNVLVDRYGEVWLLAREKSNSSGNISGTALHEALEGRAGCVSAADRGLSDTTSANANLFAIAAQNNGTGEHWGDAMVDAIAVCSAVALECLNRAHAGYVTQHRVLTARKIDNCGDNCPYDFQPLIADALTGKGPPAPPPPPTTLLEVGVFLLFSPGGATLCGAGYVQDLDGESYDLWSKVPGIVTLQVDQRGYDKLTADCLFGRIAADYPDQHPNFAEYK